MLRVIDGRTPQGRAEVDSLRRRLSFDEGLTSQPSPMGDSGSPAPSPTQTVAEIIANVRRRGDSAIAEYVRRFDGIDLDPARLAVSEAQLAAARETMARDRPGFLDAVRRIADRIRDYQSAILQPSPPDQYREGLRLGVRLRPLSCVGVYVPGGAGRYPSSVLMTVVPAQVAGVAEIVLCSPPVRPDSPPIPNRPDSHQPETRLEVLAVAAELGIRRVFRVGGVQAIAAMAYGTATIPPVDKIVGPGNLFVTLAKRAVYGQCDIDGLAGPSEVIVLADAHADPRIVAADLLAQAEHDPGCAVLISPSASLIAAVVGAVADQVARRQRHAAVVRALAQYCAAVEVQSLPDAIALTNQFAPEHLSVQTADAAAVAEQCVNAGAVFVGRWSPVAYGDYVSGPSHVLPTGGTPRFASGLTANTFLKSSSFVEYTSPAGFAAHRADALLMAEVEAFEAHAASILARTDPV